MNIFKYTINFNYEFILLLKITQVQMNENIKPDLKKLEIRSLDFMNKYCPYLNQGLKNQCQVTEVIFI